MNLHLLMYDSQGSGVDNAVLNGVRKIGLVHSWYRPWPGLFVIRTTSSAYDIYMALASTLIDSPYMVIPSQPQDANGMMSQNFWNWLNHGTVPDDIPFIEN